MTLFNLDLVRFLRLTAPLIALTMPALAQTAQISGRITDSKESVIVDAAVTATNAGTGISRKTTSNSEGYYALPLLPPGEYQLTVQRDGFRTIKRAGVKLEVAQSAEINFTLDVGQVTETVNITADAYRLRTQDAQTGEVINERMVRNLPQLNRDPLQLLILAGNVAGGGSRATPGSDTRINGGRTVGVEYTIDGITAGTGLAHDVIRATPTMEAVSEFKVITNGIAAEYGRLSGGAVELVTRSGANDFHGQVFDYLQNDNFNANSWQQNTLGGKKAEFKRNNFGAAIGGPVRVPWLYNGANRTFFFFNYDGVRRRQAGTLKTTSVPSELERRGDFSQTVYNGIRPTLYDMNGPVSYDAASNTYRRTALLGDGKRIPDNIVSPVSKAILKYVPLPNFTPRPGTSSTSNYVAPQSSFDNADMWAVRLDHQFSEAHKTYGRFARRDADSGVTRWAGPLTTANQNNVGEAWGLTLNHDWTVSPSLLVNLRAGGNFNPFTQGNLLPDDVPTDIPFDPITKQLLGKNLPLVRMAGGYNLAFPESRNVTNSTTAVFGGAVTKIAGRHTWKAGYEHRRFYDNFSGASGGTFSFHAGPVHEIAGVDFGFGSDVSIAYGLAAFLIGVNNQAVVNGPTTRAMNLNYHAFYLQDDWKVSNRLTLNLGARWDFETPVTERFDKLYVWDPDAPPPFKINAGYDFNAAVRAAGLDPARIITPEWVSKGFPNGAIRIANTPEYTSRNATEINWTQVAPRVGAAYKLNDKTVLRGSFGQMYIPTTGSAGAFSSGGQSVRLSDGADAGWHASNDNLVHLISNFQSPYQPGQFSRYERTNAAANFQATGATGPAAFNRKSHMPYEWTWNASVQRELPWQMLFEASLNGNHGRQLLGVDLQGPVPRQIFSGGQAGDNAKTYTVQVASPTAGQTQSNNIIGPKQQLAILETKFPYYGVLGVLGANFGRSNYTGLNLRLERRLSQGLSFLANYTLSRSEDDVGGPDVVITNITTAGNASSKRPQGVDPWTITYGLSPFDETHRLVATANWEIPVGRGRWLLGNPDNFAEKVLDQVAGGWELAGIGVIRSGRPLIFQARTPNINNNIRVEWSYGSYTTSDTNLSNPNFTGKQQVFYSTRDPRPSNLVRRFDPSKVTDAQLFTYGTLPPIYSDIRQSSNYNYDMSLMKAFFFDGERKRYLQFRMEGRNIFNIRGFGNYNLTIGTADFGLITSPGNTERQIQMSARFVF